MVWSSAAALAAALAGVVTSTLAAHSLTTSSTPLEFAQTAIEDTFDWDAIEPSRDLVYHDCYKSSRCARLEVPLDWLNESDPRTAAIAIRTLPAQVADDDPLFGGSILTNPGGPGGSGVSFVGSAGGTLQQYLDQPGRRHYEIVSFDPRGIGRTTPVADCFNHDLLARDAWLLQLRGNGPLSSGDKSIRFGLALMESLSRQCNQTEQRWGDAMAYVNTPSVARDMVAIVDKIDELRKREAALKQSNHFDLKKRLHVQGDKDVPRLQYIGFSYGTVLGNYFASLFPGRVGRVILDGVCDTDDYANGPGWTANTVDTDEILDKFFEGCFAAGPTACALAGSFSSPEKAQHRFWEVVNSLDDMPQAVMDSQGQPVAISGQDLTTFLGVLFYSPVAGFKPLAAVLQMVFAGSLTVLADFVDAAGSYPSLQNACPLPNGTLVESDRNDALSAVVCSDGDSLLGKDTQWWSHYVNGQLSTSRILGSFWSVLRFTCSFWPFRPNWSFKGPFTTPKASPALKKGVPAAPLLFLSNVLDPVTPLRAARKMAAQHPGAHVVAQDSIGHCALFSAPSPCTRAIVAEYLETGRVPSGESYCNTTCGPWDESCLMNAAGADAVSNLFLGDSNGFVRKKFPLGVQ